MLDQVMASLDTLSPAEKRVGKLVIQNPRRFAMMSTSEIANECYVSQPTVVRFCKGLGYDGLTQFKQKLRSDDNGGVPYVHAAVDCSDSPANVSLKVVDSSIASLALFRTHVPRVSIDRACCELANAHNERRCLSFYGSGHSGIVAQDAQLRFSRLGFSTVACCDGYAQMINASSRRAGDLVVATSSSGRTKELLDAVDIAKQRGATVIVLTGTGTPLSTMGSIHLAIDHLEDHERFAPMSSRLLQLIMTDILATAVALKVGREALHGQLERTQHLLRHRRYA
jgi:RpiR family transcriptional regulator, carbohydrate utilization regulator